MVKYTKMATIEKIKELIKYSIATMFVKPSEKGAYFCPVNLMLIAPPETGKTRILKGFFCKKTLEIMDLSPKLIKEAIIPKLESQEIKFLIIPDLIQLLGHKQNTVRSTIGFLNALIEEGVKDNLFYGMEFHLKEFVHCGLITAITTQEFYKNILDWNGIGFLHRIMPISYDYSKGKIHEIHKEIASGQMFKESNEISVGNGNNKFKPISIPEKYSADIQLIVFRVMERLKTFSVKSYKGSKSKNKEAIFFDSKGFRLHDRLRQLARAICYIDGNGKRKSVNADDINKLREITEVINFPNSKSLI